MFWRKTLKLHLKSDCLLLFLQILALFRKKNLSVMFTVTKSMKLGLFKWMISLPAQSEVPNWWNWEDYVTPMMKQPQTFNQILKRNLMPINSDNNCVVIEKDTTNSKIGGIWWWCHKEKGSNSLRICWHVYFDAKGGRSFIKPERLFFFSIN